MPVKLQHRTMSDIKQTIKRDQWEHQREYKVEDWIVLSEGSPVVLTAKNGNTFKAQEIRITDQETAEGFIKNAPTKYNMIPFYQAKEKFPSVVFDHYKILYTDYLRRPTEPERLEYKQRLKNEVELKPAYRPIYQIDKIEEEQPIEEPADHPHSEKDTLTWNEVDGLKTELNDIKDMKKPLFKIPESWPTIILILFFSNLISYGIGNDLITRGYRTIDTWDERAFWAASIGIIGTACFFIGKLWQKMNTK